MSKLSKNQTLMDLLSKSSLTNTVKAPTASEKNSKRSNSSIGVDQIKKSRNPNVKSITIKKNLDDKNLSFNLTINNNHNNIDVSNTSFKDDNQKLGVMKMMHNSNDSFVKKKDNKSIINDLTQSKSGSFGSNNQFDFSFNNHFNMKETKQLEEFKQIIEYSITAFSKNQEFVNELIKIVRASFEKLNIRLKFESEDESLYQSESTNQENNLLKLENKKLSNKIEIIDKKFDKLLNENREMKKEIQDKSMKFEELQTTLNSISKELINVKNKTQGSSHTLNNKCQNLNAKNSNLETLNATLRNNNISFGSLRSKILSNITKRSTDDSKFIPNSGEYDNQISNTRKDDIDNKKSKRDYFIDIDKVNDETEEFEKDENIENETQSIIISMKKSLQSHELREEPGKNRSLNLNNNSISSSIKEKENLQKNKSTKLVNNVNSKYHRQDKDKANQTSSSIKNNEDDEVSNSSATAPKYSIEKDKLSSLKRKIGGNPSSFSIDLNQQKKFDHKLGESDSGVIINENTSNKILSEISRKLKK